MPVETLSPFVTPTPDLGGRYIPDFNPNDTIVIARSVDRNLPLTEDSKPHNTPLELAPDLIINPIPNWDSIMAMRCFVKDINKGLEEGKSFLEAVSKSAKELEMNIRSYNSEIIKSRVVLPHINRFDLVDGVVRMVGNNGRPVVDSVSAKERRGSVLDASEEVEKSLIGAGDNSFAVLMNPAGWNGLTDEFGREALPHLNAQTLVFWKDREGDLKGLTFHTDLQQEQAKNIMLSLGVLEGLLKGGSEQERIANIVRNPALLSLPKEYANPFEYVLDVITAKRGQGDFKLRQQDGTVEIRSIEGVKTDIKRFDQLLKGSEEEERHIGELINYILTEAPRIQDRAVQQQVIYKIEKTILRLTRVYLQDTGKIPILQPDVSSQLTEVLHRSSDERDNNFAREIAYLKTRAGCPPSMIALAGISLGSVGTATIGGIQESDSKGSLYFPCPACGTINKRPREGYVPRCQNQNCISPDAVRC